MYPAQYQELFLAVKKQKGRNIHTIQEAVLHCTEFIICIIKGQEALQELREGSSLMEGRIQPALEGWADR